MSLKIYKGFTLIEVIIVSTMIFFVAGAVFGAISSSINILKRAENLSRYEDVQVFFEKIERDLRNSIVFSEISFEGGSTHLIFPALIKKPFRKSILKEKTQVAMDQITWVKYIYDRNKKIVYKEELDFLEYSGKDEAKKKILLKDVASCKLEYYFYSSSNQLNEVSVLKKGTIPHVVKIIVSLKKPDGKKMEFTEFVEIPIA